MIYAKTIAERIYDKCSDCPYCKLNTDANAYECQISKEIISNIEVRREKCLLILNTNVDKNHNIV